MAASGMWQTSSARGLPDCWGLNSTPLLGSQELIDEGGSEASEESNHSSSTAVLDNGSFGGIIFTHTASQPQLRYMTPSAGHHPAVEQHIRQQQQPGLLLCQPAARLPDFAVPLQPKLLKAINSFNTKEELLAWTSSCHFLLDPINLVTTVYRLARMFCSIRNPEARAIWRAELIGHSTFQVLLRAIQSQLLHAQLTLMHNEEVKGLDARCVSNLIWAIVKLELASDHGHLGSELVLTATPLVIRFLPQSSSQGLANLLWAYAKMTVPPLEVMMIIISRMAEKLMERDASTQFDAQALSNSVWALAHIRSKAADLDVIAGREGCVMDFLRGIATCASSLLHGLSTRLDANNLQGIMFDAEKRFSCQAMVNIVWSFAAMLGKDCGTEASFKSMFALIRREAIIRLHATSAGLQLSQSWVHRLNGGFNEQALSNIVYAFDKAHMLDRELLQWVFNVAALRLDRMETKEPCFKPQELCTLLRASHQPIAQPWTFLAKLHKVVQTMPWIINGWSSSEVAELNHAFSLLRDFTAPLMQQHVQHHNTVVALPQSIPSSLAAAAAQLQQQQQQRVRVVQGSVPMTAATAAAMANLSGVAATITDPLGGLLVAQHPLQQLVQQQYIQQQHVLPQNYATANVLHALLPSDLF